MFLEIFISIIASIIAGIGTGLVGLSAATAITPLLIKCGIPVHQAIYIALMSDVIASAFTSREYALNKHLVRNASDDRNNLPITWLVFAFSIAFTIVGALISSKMPDVGVGTFARYVSLFVGSKFIIEFVISTIKKDNHGKNNKLVDKLQNHANKTVEFVATVVGGAIIGLSSGFAGVGGGMTMLLVYRAFGYQLKDAVCVSTITMVFVAFIGGVLHYHMDDATVSSWLILAVCAITTTISAWITSRLANKASDKYHKLFCGVLLLTALIITSIF